MKYLSAGLISAALLAGNSVANAADTAPQLKTFLQTSHPDGQYVTWPPIIVPQAGCHPHCSLNPSDGAQYGDYHSYEFKLPPGQPGQTVTYQNPRILAGTGVDDGCKFDPSVGALNPENYTFSITSRSTPCTLQFEFDRFVTDSK